MENGTVTLIGATTENPSFALNGALLSRCQVLVLRRLDDAALELLLARAEADIGRALPLDAEARAHAARHGRWRRPLPAEHGRADRRAAARHAADGRRRRSSALLARRAALYDKDREEHYNLISALHKSLRGSDPDAALYWFARMLNGGEDPRYIARRLVRFAAEDIGMADPQALTQALAGWETYERLGSPGGRTGDRAGGGLSRHRAEIERALHRVSAQARARGQGHRQPDAAGAYPQRADQADEAARLRRRLRIRPRGGGRVLRARTTFPTAWSASEFYRPRDRGFEREIGKRLEHWAKLRAERQDG